MKIFSALLALCRWFETPSRPLWCHCNGENNRPLWPNNTSTPHSHVTILAVLGGSEISDRCFLTSLKRKRECTKWNNIWLYMNKDFSHLQINSSMISLVSASLKSLASHPSRARSRCSRYAIYHCVHFFTFQWRHDIETSFPLLAFIRGIHRSFVDSQLKGSVMHSFDNSFDVCLWKLFAHKSSSRWNEAS